MTDIANFTIEKNEMAFSLKNKIVLVTDFQKIGVFLGFRVKYSIRIAIVLNQTDSLIYWFHWTKKLFNIIFRFLLVIVTKDCTVCLLKAVYIIHRLRFSTDLLDSYLLGAM